MICKLSDNFNSVANRLEKRMCEIEGNVEKRLTVKFNTVIHDRVHKEVCQLKDQISTEVNELKEKVISLEKSYPILQDDVEPTSVKGRNGRL